MHWFDHFKPGQPWHPLQTRAHKIKKGMKRIKKEGVKWNQTNFRIKNNSNMNKVFQNIYLQYIFAQNYIIQLKHCKIVAWVELLWIITNGYHIIWPFSWNIIIIALLTIKYFFSYFTVSWFHSTALYSMGLCPNYRGLWNETTRLWNKKKIFYC